MDPKIIVNVLKEYLDNHYPNVEIAYEKNESLGGYNINFKVPVSEESEFLKFIDSFMPFSYMITPIKNKEPNGERKSE